ncbi:hypothetical protein M2401_002380 [Pseudomonas sp. JUb42]|jgi:hypothetical protein|nr:hypothetical protein [Pseudomonas sp. JUb42]
MNPASTKNAIPWERGLPAKRTVHPDHFLNLKIAFAGKPRSHGRVISQEDLDAP